MYMICCLAVPVPFPYHSTSNETLPELSRSPRNSQLRLRQSHMRAASALARGMPCVDQTLHRAASLYSFSWNIIKRRDSPGIGISSQLVQGCVLSLSGGPLRLNIALPPFRSPTVGIRRGSFTGYFRTIPDFDGFVYEV
jgi:hypothetical protein